MNEQELREQISFLDDVEKRVLEVRSQILEVISVLENVLKKLGGP